MHTGSINVALGPICSLACQCHMLLRKNSTIDVLVISMSWIIVYANCIFSLYAFPSTHSKHDECDNNLTTNSWIFNIFFSLCSFQLLFYFYSFQQLCFLLSPLFMLTPLIFLFPCYLL
jgi:hypothetical protein